MGNYIVTIISPCFNGEKHLKPYFEGLLSQTYQNVQYIFVNDGSMDKTEEIALSYKDSIEAKGWEFNYISQENKGQAAAINKGLKIAIGKYLSCIDSDDILMPTYIEEMSEYLENNFDCGICFPTTEFIKEEDHSHINYRKRVIVKGCVDNFVEEMFLKSANLPAFSTFMLRMDDFKKYTPSGQLYEGFSGQNPQLILPIAYNTSVGYLDKVLIKVVTRQNSDSHTDLITKSYNWEDLYCKVLDMIPNMPEHEKVYLYSEIKKRWSKFRENKVIELKKESHKVLEFCGVKIKLRNRPKNPPKLNNNKPCGGGGSASKSSSAFSGVRENLSCCSKFSEIIFSVKNEKRNGCKHRIVTILGLKIKYKVKKNLKKFFKKAVKNSFLPAQKAHQETIKRLQEEVKHRKLRVCFLVQETQKWNAQSLYDEMEKSDIFEPFVVVTRLPDNNYRNSFEHNVEFFKNQCKNVEIGFDETTETPIDIKSFKPDIVFYQQPWGLFYNQNPEYVSQFALPYYFPYSIANTPLGLESRIEPFYLKLRKHFVFSSAEEKQYGKIFGYEGLNISIVGHPKMDIYSNYKEEAYERKYVIYAPHHSLEEKYLCYGTFQWNGKYILEWAKAHPEFHWLFKPHPRLKIGLINAKIMTEQEVEKYYNEWAKIGSYYDDGSYFDLFKNSKCLITDCGSFLTEYLPTRQPVIHLRNPKSKNFSATNELIMKSYYKAWNLKDLDKHLNNVLLNGQDCKKQQRLNILKSLKLDNMNATGRIINELLKDMKVEIKGE